MEKGPPLVVIFFCRVSARRLSRQKRFRDDMAHRISSQVADAKRSRLMSLRLSLFHRMVSDVLSGPQCTGSQRKRRGYTWAGCGCRTSDKRPSVHRYHCYAYRSQPNPSHSPPGPNLKFV
jgi:hypothetical protein